MTLNTKFYKKTNCIAQRISPGTISVKFLPKGQRWPRYQMAYKHCRKFQSPE